MQRVEESNQQLKAKNIHYESGSSTEVIEDKKWTNKEKVGSDLKIMVWTLNVKNRILGKAVSDIWRNH